MTKNPKRPADMNKLAKSIVDIATGEVDETPTKTVKSAGLVFTNSVAHTLRCLI